MNATREEHMRLCLMCISAEKIVRMSVINTNDIRQKGKTMSRQEAIRHLEAARLMLLGKDGQPISDLYDALSIAIEALERSET